jgi:hypothetical protein
MSPNYLKYEKIYSNSFPYGKITAIYIIIVTSITAFLIVSLLVVVFKDKYIERKTGMKLSIILLFLDLIISITTLINSLFAIVHYSNNLNSRLACTLNAISIGLPYVISINLMGIISLERCLLVVFKRACSRNFYFGLLLIFALLNSINFILGGIFNAFEVFPIALYCFFHPTSLAGFIGSIATVLILVPPYSLIVFCYIAICVYRRNQSQIAQLELGLDPTKVRKEVNSTILKSLLLITTSLFTSGIYVAIMIVSWFKPSILNPKIDMFQIIFLESQMIVNTSLLLNMQPKLWKGLKKLYGIERN